MTNQISKKIVPLLLACGSLLLVPHHLYAQRVTTFTDVTAAAGFSGCPTCQLNSTWSHAWADYDGDGYVDIITLGHVQPSTNSVSQVWHNNKNGTFTDVTTQVGIPLHDADCDHAACWADFDNDGHPDLFISKEKWTQPPKYDRLWHNNGNGTFTNIAPSAGVEAPSKNRGAYAVDYDNDSFLDLFVGSFQSPSIDRPNHFYHNNGDLTFTDVATDTGLARPFIENRSALWADYDGDGLMDVFIAKTDALYHNNGDGTFTDVTDAAGIIHNSFDVQASAWGDYDNDGYPDLYVTLGSEGNASSAELEHLQELAAIPVGLQGILYHNNGDGTFTDVTTQSGAVNVAGALGVTWEDYDNDGNLDLYIVNTENQTVLNRLFRNNGDGTFTDVAVQAGVGAKLPGDGRGSDASFADYDNDGFPDLFICNGAGTSIGTYTLFHNNANRNGWLKVVLVGTQSNRNAIGTKLALVARGKTQYREYTGQHYLSQNYIPVHFGLGRAAQVNSLTITWPSGRRQRLRNVATNQTITVVEGASDEHNVTAQVSGK